MMDSLPGTNTDSNHQGVKVTCVVKEDKNYEEVFTIPEKQAKAIFMTVNGKLPSELTFKWWNDEDQSEKKFYNDTYWSTIRHLIVQQTLFNFYMIHESFLQEEQDKTNTSLDKVNLWLLGQTNEEPEIISHGWGIFNIYLTKIVCGFMFTVPFMQFVGAHCNTNVTCIYYRMPIKVHTDSWINDDTLMAKIFQNWILKILTFLGDNGKYNWIVNLDKQADCGGFFKINQSMLDYMNYNQDFAVFLHALQNKDKFENVATMTFKRKRDS